MERKSNLKKTNENMSFKELEFGNLLLPDLPLSDFSDCDFTPLLDDSEAYLTNLEDEENQTEQPIEVVRLFQDIYQADSKQPVFLYNLKLTGEESAFQHRIILKAEPQIGKT